MTAPSTPTRIPLIFDCDTGIDDALALFYGAAHGAEFVACTVTHGNVPVDVGTRNTLTILEALGLEQVPVFTGAARPLAQPLMTAEFVHGHDGLGDAGVTPSSRVTGDLAAVVERIAAIGSPLARFVVDVLGFFASTYSQQQGFDAPPVHDPCCVALVADPAVVETRDAFVAVELTGTWTTGMTVTDFGDAYGQPHHTHVATRLDRGRFWDMTVAAIAALSKEGAA